MIYRSDCTLFAPNSAPKYIFVHTDVQERTSNCDNNKRPTIGDRTVRSPAAVKRNGRNVNSTRRFKTEADDSLASSTTESKPNNQLEPSHARCSCEMAAGQRERGRAGGEVCEKAVTSEQKQIQEKHVTYITNRTRTTLTSAHTAPNPSRT